MRLFSTEQVSKYHPDKVCDQISDAILDACLAEDPKSRVACETLFKEKTIIIAGEITTTANVCYERVARQTAAKLGYECDSILNLISTQSPEIAKGVGDGEEQGAGDQGMMYGYACNETESMLPYGFDLANRIVQAIEDDIDQRGASSPYKGDAKCQVTVDLDEKPDMRSVKKILVSVCHKNRHHIGEVREYTEQLLHNLGVPNDVEITINPAGVWTLGGPRADCGLTGRKIVCDQYGGYCAVGGGAFSGKDPSKVDRSAAYFARALACKFVELFELKECEVQLAYSIGIAEPASVSVKCVQPDGTVDDGLGAEIERTLGAEYDLTPHGIIEQLDLLKPQYERIAGGCHYRTDRWRI